MTREEIKAKKRYFLDTVLADVPIRTMYYDRKECESLTVEELDFLVKQGHLGLSEVILALKKAFYLDNGWVRL